MLKSRFFIEIRFSFFFRNLQVWRGFVAVFGLLAPICFTTRWSKLKLMRFQVRFERVGAFSSQIRAVLTSEFSMQKYVFLETFEKASGRHMAPSWARLGAKLDQLGGSWGSNFGLSCVKLHQVI